MMGLKGNSLGPRLQPLDRLRSYETHEMRLVRRGWVCRFCKVLEPSLQAICWWRVFKTSKVNHETKPDATQNELHEAEDAGEPDQQGEARTAAG